MNGVRNLTRVGADLRQIAALLQAQGRGRDTVLAHITPQEAALLKSRGGRGSINPATGLPEFEDDVGNIEDYQTPEPTQSFPVTGGSPSENFVEVGTPQSFTPAPENLGYQGLPEDAQGSYPVELPEEFRVSAPELAARLRAQQPTDLPAPPEAAVPAGPQMEPPTVPGQGMSEDLKRRLGLAGIQALSTGLLANRAGQQQRSASQQIEQIGAPYRARGAELMGLAQQGQLTAVGQQQLDALRAQMAQRAAGRGGVGAAQIAQQTEAFRQQLLAQQYDLGLKLSGISDQYALQAIKSGMSADQAVNQLLASAMNNIGRIFAGQPAPQTPRPPGGP